MTTDAAVITDVHGNLPALQAALARIDALGIEHVYCGGDLVGYGPHPNAQGSVEWTLAHTDRRSKE